MTIDFDDQAHIKVSRSGWLISYKTPIWIGEPLQQDWKGWDFQWSCTLQLNSAQGPVVAIAFGESAAYAAYHAALTARAIGEVYMPKPEREVN